MKVYIKRENGQTISIDVDPNSSISTVFLKLLTLQLFANVNIAKQVTLGFEGRNLDLSKTLADYNIQEGAVIHEIQENVTCIPKFNLESFVDVKDTQEMASEEEPAIPDNLICPLSGQMFFNPVKLPTGTVVERDCIEKWIQTKGECPFTRKPLVKSQLIVDDKKKNEAAKFLDKYKSSKFYDSLKEKQYKSEKKPEIVSIGAHPPAFIPSFQELFLMNLNFNPVDETASAAAPNPILPFFNHLRSYSGGMHADFIVDELDDFESERQAFLRYDSGGGAQYRQYRRNPQYRRSGEQASIIWRHCRNDYS